MWEAQAIAAFNANARAGKLCGFFRVKRKRSKESISESIPEQHGSTIWGKGGLVLDFENINFLHLELLPPRQVQLLEFLLLFSSTQMSLIC
jgi:hypothetical protein